MVKQSKTGVQLNAWTVCVKQESETTYNGGGCYARQSYTRLEYGGLITRLNWYTALSTWLVTALPLPQPGRSAAELTIQTSPDYLRIPRLTSPWRES